MDDTELASLVAANIRDSVGYLDSELSQKRENMLRYYNGEVPDVEDREGYSTVVSRDVMEAVEEMLPALIKVFHSSGHACEFEPQGPEDEEAAEQATDYVNYIYNRDNEGWRISYEVLKDGLIQITGITKTYWEDYETEKEETYTGLTQEEVSALESDEALEVVEMEQDGEIPVSTDEMGQFIYAPTFTVRVVRTEQDGKVCVESIAPEDFLVRPRMKRLDPKTEPAFFCAHRVQTSRSQLIEDGYDPELVYNLPEDNDAQFDTEKDARYDDENERIAEYEPGNEIVLIYECYLNSDYDGDGVTELRKVVTGGLQGGDILLNEECEEFPFDLFCPYLMPHAVFGESLAEKTQDIQKLKTVTWRQVMDNMYLTNNPEMEIPDVAVTDGTYDDLTERKIGGFVRTKEGGHLRPLTVPFAAEAGLQVIQYVDTVRDARTGVSDTANGTNPDLLQSHTRSDVKNMIISASQERIELVARIAAETFYKPLFRRILRLVIKYQPKERMIRLRGHFVPMDPRSWNASMDMSVNVGLGTGDKSQKIAYLMQILGVQREAIMQPTLGLVKPKNIYNTLEELTKAIDLSSVEPYFMDPEGPEAQQFVQQVTGAMQGQGGDPEAQAYMMAEQMKNQREGQKALLEHERDLMKMQAQMQLEVMKILNSRDADQDKLDFDIWKVQQELMAQYGIAVDTAQIKAEVEKVRAMMPRQASGAA